MSVFIKFLVSAFGPSLAKAGGLAIITMILTGGGCNTIHKWRDYWQQRKHFNAGYTKGYEDAKAACEDAGGQIDDRRRRWRLFPLREEPSWMKITEFAVPVGVPSDMMEAE